MRERNLYSAGGSKFHGGSQSCFGEKTLVASRLAVKTAMENLDQLC